MQQSLEVFEDDRPPTHIAGRAIDHIWHSACMAPALVKAATDPRWRFPSHRAVWADFDIEQLTRHIPDDQGVPLNTPASLPIDKKIKTYLENMPWAYHQDELGRAMEAGDVDLALDSSLEAWTERWEAATISAAEELEITVSEHMRGRARGEIAPLMTNTTQIPARSAHLPLAIRQLRRSWSMMREWLVESARADTFLL
eukprot:112520-Amphidinium_carterae.1